MNIGNKQSVRGRGRLMRRFAVMAVTAAVAATLALLAWAVVDFSAQRRASLRDFDPNEVACLETAMWQSYYDRRRLQLFGQLGELLHTQYGLSFWRSNAAAYHAAKAAFIFKDGRQRGDYERALPDLVDYYRAVRDVSDAPFDVERVARLELEWWIIHRERKSYRPGDLERALAALPAELYRIPAERLAEHARLRAEAMIIRDTRAEEAGGVTAADWARIDELLHASWQSLWQAVNA